MIGWLFVVVVIVSLGALNMPSQMLSQLSALPDGAWFGVMLNTLVVGCIFLCHWCWQMTSSSRRFTKMLATHWGGGTAVFNKNRASTKDS